LIGGISFIYCILRPSRILQTVFKSSVQLAQLRMSL